jgi:hypothetical protein
MKITYQIDDEGLLFVNPYGSGEEGPFIPVGFLPAEVLSNLEKKGPYIPVGFLPAKVLANLERIIQEVQSKSQENKK